MPKKRATKARLKLAFDVGDPLFPGSEYTIVDSKDRTSGKAAPIASGGAGQVYKAAFKGMDRAIKVLAPEELPPIAEDSEGSRSAWQKFTETFDHEVKILMQITHTNVAKILDYGICKGGVADKHPFYVMEFIPGLRLKQAVEEWVTNSKQLLSLVSDIVDALTFLHERSILHARY